LSFTRNEDLGLTFVLTILNLPTRIQSIEGLLVTLSHRDKAARFDVMSPISQISEVRTEVPNHEKLFLGKDIGFEAEIFLGRSTMVAQSDSEQCRRSRFR
jgi:hypothetical protein